MAAHRRSSAQTVRSRWVVVVVGVLSVFVTAALAGWFGRGWSESPGTSIASGPRRTSPPPASASGSQGAPSTPVPRRTLGPVASRCERVGQPRWVTVLHRLDRRRERAWRTGRPGQLADVFEPGSAVLRRDAAALRAYRRRSLRVSGVAMSFGRVRQLSSGHAAAHLRVVDRLTAAVAHGPDDSRTPLPTDRPSRHLIVLTCTSRGWRIADVQAV